MLPTDSYAATLCGAVDGFLVAGHGEALDGDGDGTPGGDFWSTFSASPAATIVTVQDFVVGRDSRSICRPPATTIYPAAPNQRG